MTVDAFEHDDPAAVEFYRANGWVLLHTFDDDGVAHLRQWADEIAAWDDADGEWLHYRELTDFGPKLCRTENFVPFHAGLRELLTQGVVPAVAASLLGEPVHLYKEKVNYKLAGGAGFSAHQDAPAYPFLDQHVSCMIAIDDADTENGCLEVASGWHRERLAVDSVGCVRGDIVAQFEWTATPAHAGQTLWFHSLTPHRSGANHSSRDRRALYPTYNAASEGDLRDAYYREKLDRMARQRVGEHVQVSLIGDFQGRPVD